VDAGAVDPTFVVPEVGGLDVGALPEEEETGVAATGDDVGVVDVCVGSAGDAGAVEPRFVVPDMGGLDVGALPDGEETGGAATGDGVGVVEVWVGCAGEATGVGGPAAGAEVGCCGGVGVGARVGG